MPDNNPYLPFNMEYVRTDGRTNSPILVIFPMLVIYLFCDVRVQGPNFEFSHSA